MSREFPFLNEEAEGLWDGNKIFEAQTSAEMLNQDRILINNCEKYLALTKSVKMFSGGWLRKFLGHTMVPRAHDVEGKSWELSSICSLGENGGTMLK